MHLIGICLPLAFCFVSQIMLFIRLHQWLMADICLYSDCHWNIHPWLLPLVVLLVGIWWFASRSPASSICLLLSLTVRILLHITLDSHALCSVRRFFFPEVYPVYFYSLNWLRASCYVNQILPPCLLHWDASHDEAFSSSNCYHASSSQSHGTFSHHPLLVWAFFFGNGSSLVETQPYLCCKSPVLLGLVLMSYLLTCVGGPLLIFLWVWAVLYQPCTHLSSLLAHETSNLLLASVGASLPLSFLF